MHNTNAVWIVRFSINRIRIIKGLLYNLGEKVDI